ncbi:1,3-beta-glucanosyltransferase [Mycena venus]|uniref:1,3-beta-glucanosyltransferase n=1 Tax=Mycena venus TaxID=2733690 RepID=A0A8H6YVP2_9AGAR|nr:1,3-beta-glucanosyltransferase [Mycena venus]
MKLAVFLLASAAIFVPITSASGISKITRTGRYLYSADGNRFYVKGALSLLAQIILIMSPIFVIHDNLADGAACSRDLPNLQKLGVNVIRAYYANSSLSHDACMSVLSGAGIYAIIDLSLPLNGSIDSSQPVWSTNLLDQYLRTIDAFSKYDNVLAFNLGNEVLSEPSPNLTSAAPFLKAAARDIKAYLTSISSSALVGYVSLDGITGFRDAVADYLSCDPSSRNSGSTSIDLFGLNNYEWCGNSANTTYDALNTEFEDYNVVAYFSEFGSEACNPGVRVWTETGTLFSAPMTNVWSGGVAYNYFPQPIDFNDAVGTTQFGLVTVASDDAVTTNVDFDNLAAQYAKVSLVNSPSQGSVAASRFGVCPSNNAQFVASTTLPPTPNDIACTCLASKLSCVFTPSTSLNLVSLTKNLTDEVCSQLPQVGGNCTDIRTNGTTGLYGIVGISPTHLACTMNSPTRATLRGNAKINATATGSTSAALSTCIPSPSAVFTPSAPPGGVLVPTSSSSTMHGTASPSQTSSVPQPGPSKSHIAAIIGGCVGGLVLAAGLVLFIVWYRKRQRQNLQGEQDMSSVIPVNAETVYPFVVPGG